MRMPTDHAAAILLRRALLSNAAFSASCGVVIMLFDETIVSLITTMEHRLWPLGLMLVGFAASLAWFATRRTLTSAWVCSVIVADFAWVVGTVVLLAGWHEQLSAAGVAILIAIGAVVLLFGELQWIGLKRLQSAMPGA